MIKLFKRDGYDVKVDPEALLLKPFKKIWDRDKSKDKNRAMQELGFIYFVCDPRSDYQYLVDIEVRKEGYFLESRKDIRVFEDINSTLDIVMVKNNA
jgi:hypothetical protein